MAMKTHYILEVTTINHASEAIRSLWIVSIERLEGILAMLDKWSLNFIQQTRTAPAIKFKNAE